MTLLTFVSLGNDTTVRSIYRTDTIFCVLDIAILGLLMDRDHHGYEIRTQLRERLGVWANVSFGSIYPALARRYHVAFVPFLLQGVAGDARLNQRDGIHPTAEGARIVAENVWAVLRPIVEERTPRD